MRLKLFRREKQWTNKEMLELIRADRSAQVIHSVMSYKKNKYGFYDVHVDMEGGFFGTIIKHYKLKLPYPLSKFDELSLDKKNEWRDT